MRCNRPHLIPALVTSVMLLAALAHCPIGYYQLIRFVVCSVAVYIALKAYDWQILWIMWLFGFIAMLFNPLIPIYLTREIWQFIDIICAILFIVIALFFKKPAEVKQEYDKSHTK